ncbi:MAG: hypothetical protein J0L82_04335 [Deltaproteobacteria bacterium]|nr:hypothetical protein [Deltaproteobacteria bacterium]
MDVFLEKNDPLGKTVRARVKQCATSAEVKNPPFATVVTPAKAVTPCGTNAPSNLRILCRTHNLMVAEQTFGREKIEAFRRRM